MLSISHRAFRTLSATKSRVFLSTDFPAAVRGQSPAASHNIIEEGHETDSLDALRALKRETRREALAAGADGFLRKPVSRARLAAEIARFLPCAPEATVSAGAPRLLTPEARAALPDLLAQLDGEALGEWEKLKEAFFIDRMATFSARMGVLAGQYQEPELAAWATLVQDQARAYDMENLPTTFKRFPEVLAGIRRLVSDNY